MNFVTCRGGNRSGCQNPPRVKKSHPGYSPSTWLRPAQDQCWPSTHVASGWRRHHWLPASSRRSERWWLAGGSRFGFGWSMASRRFHSPACWTIHPPAAATCVHILQGIPWAVDPRQWCAWNSDRAAVESSYYSVGFQTGSAERCWRGCSG